MKKLIATVLSAIMIVGFSVGGVKTYAQSKEITGEIVISCYESMTYKSFLDNAARAFEEKYPGTKINVKTFSAMPEFRTTSSSDGRGMSNVVSIMEDINDPKAKSDYLTQINTDMISGGGADIYAADIIPYYKYADNGMLVDMREFMDSDPDFDYSDYQENIFDATMYNGGQYILPMDYGFNCLSYDSTLMDEAAQNEFSFGTYTYERLVELGLDSFINEYDPDAENPIKLFNLYAGDGGLMAGSSLFASLINANYNIFVDVINKKANFNDGRFADILKLVREYEEKGYLNVPIDIYAMMQSGSDRGIMRQMTSQSYLYKLTSQMMLLQALNTDESNTRSFMYAGTGTLTEDDNLIGLIANENGEAAFSVSQAYAINANSKNKDMAWEFIKFLLSDEMQSSRSIRNNPINKYALDQKTILQISGESFAPMNMARTVEAAPSDEGSADERNTGDGGTFRNPDISNEDIEAMLNEYSNSGYDASNVELTEAQQKVYDEYMSYMDKYSSMLNSYLIQDTIVDEMIDNEIKNFFDGSRTAEEVASALQNKVNMYLQE